MSRNRMMIPVVNLSTISRSTIEAWDLAMTKYGFAIVEGHSVPQENIEQLSNHAFQFFHQSQQEKLKHNFGPYGNPMGGFTPQGVESVGLTTSSDIVESYVFPNKMKSQTHHPTQFHQAALKYRFALTQLLEQLHQLSALALGLPSNYFSTFYEPGDYSLRLAYYPAIEETNGAQLRYGAHTDYTGFTILYQGEQDTDNTDGGLQVYIPETEEWIRVKSRPNSFVVNAGDLWPIWTNGKWRSALHRVTAGSSLDERLSIPFFTGPNGNTLVKPLIQAYGNKKFSPILANDHLKSRLKKSNL